jgi:hypothetical protein
VTLSTALFELTRQMLVVAAQLAEGGSVERVWSRHLVEDARGLTLLSMAQREPEEVNP